MSSKVDPSSERRGEVEGAAEEGEEVEEDVISRGVAAIDEIYSVR